MWVTAVLGMPISFAEAVLAQLFRVKNPDGTYRGGPAYYMEKGLHSKALSILYSISILVGIGFFYCMIQSNSISVALTGVAPVSPLAAGILLLILVALVIFGGIKRLSEVASYIVPFMALGYLIMAIWVMLVHASMLPEMLLQIFTGAFSGQAAAGGG